MGKVSLDMRSGMHGTMRSGSTAKVLAECMLKYYRISECMGNVAEKDMSYCRAVLLREGLSEELQTF